MITFAASFTTLTEKNFPFFSFLYQTIPTKLIQIKLITLQTLHFSLKKAKASLLKTENQEPLFAEMPQTLFLWKLIQYFSFMKNLTENSEKSWSARIKKITMHTATFPNGLKGYIEICIFTLKPFRYRNNDSNTMIHSVVHTYHSEVSEPFIVHYQNMKQINSSSDVNHIDLYEDAVLNKTVFFIKPSRKLAPRVFPSLQNSKEILQILKKFHFQFSDLNESEYIQRCKSFVEKKRCHATHRNFSTPFIFYSTKT